MIRARAVVRSIHILDSGEGSLRTLYNFIEQNIVIGLVSRNILYIILLGTKLAIYRVKSERQENRPGILHPYPGILANSNYFFMMVIRVHPVIIQECVLMSSQEALLSRSRR